MRFSRLFTASATSVALAMLAACAQQVGDIDRTQPNRIQKSAFEGEWYMLQTVIDTNATATLSFPGLMGNLTRVNFTIEERQLIARQTYEDVIGVDSSQFNLTSAVNFVGGPPVAIFGIQSHFDVQRSYNATTGEETNVITENASDRPWYDRQYVRIDWTRNQAPTFLDLLYDHQSYASASVAPQDETDQPTWFIERNEDGEVVYIDVVNEFIVEPDYIQCLLSFGLPWWEYNLCGPETIRIRTSFVKITEESDYIPRAYNDFDLNQFGMFRTTRCVYDRRYGCVDSSRQSMANMWNLWQRHTDDAGNVLPYNQREVRPIVFYLNDTYPIDLVGATFEATEQWSYAFRRTVAGVQGASFDSVPRMFYMCFNPGSTDPEPPAEWLDLLVTAEQKSLLREAAAASAEGYASGHCQRPGELKNLGDLRYSLIAWHNNGLFIPWGGYGPSAADPLTGQIIHAGSHLNGANYETAAQRVMDIVRIIQGELPPESYGRGEQISQYFDDLRARTNNDMFFGALPSTQKSGGPQYELALDTRVRDIRLRGERYDRLVETGRDVLQRPRVQALMERPIEDFALRNNWQRNRMRHLYDTPIEDMLAVPELVDGLGGRLVEALSARGVSLDPEVERTLTSPLRFASIEGRNRVQGLFESRLLDRSICMGGDFDPYMFGFAQEMVAYEAMLRSDYGLSGWELEQEMWRHVRTIIARPVIEHEIGHTVGLRHNFEASTDALNFHPQYWALRERTFDEDCNGSGYQTFSADGLPTGRVAPERCNGGETAADYERRSAELMVELQLGLLEDGSQLSGGIYDFQYASIMDYDAKSTTMRQGLGLYDYAAIAYAYGDLVEVFRNAPNQIAVNSQWSPTTDSFSSITVTRSGQTVRTMSDVDNYSRFRNGIQSDDTPGDGIDDNPWTYWHYSILPMMFYNEGRSVDTSSVALQHFRTIDYSGLGTMAPMYDRELVPRTQAVAENRVIVPYRFCSDEYRGSSSVCNIFDLGADELEMLTALRDTYEDYYVSMFFRRQRPGFGLNLAPLVFGVQRQYFDAAKRYYQFWLLNFSSRGLDWLNSPRGGLNQYNAAIDGINFIGEVFTTPSTGTYVYDATRDEYLNISADYNFTFPDYDPTYPGLRPSDYLRISIADGGRQGFSQFTRNEDGERGYYSFYETEVVTYFFAKYGAIFSLTDGSVDVIGVDTSSDASAFFISPYLVFEEDLTNFFGGLIMGDTRNVGRCVEMKDGVVVPSNIEMIRPNSYTGCQGTILNPYTAVFGNRDYNTQIFAAMTAAVYFPSTLDTDWFDNAGVYVWGRGEMPQILTDENGESNWEMVTFTDENGITYAARIPRDYDPTDVSARNTRVGYQLVQRLIDLQLERDHACPYQFAGNVDDLRHYCSMTVEDATAYRAANGAYVGRDFFRIRNDIDSAREVARFVNQVNTAMDTW